MPLFGRRKEAAPAQPQVPAANPTGLATSAGQPEPTADWTNPQTVRDEWQDRLEGEGEGRDGWRNGTQMFEGGVVPGQELNVAEYLTRGLAYHLFTPILTDGEAQVAARRVLSLVDEIPAEPAFFAEFGPRLARLALTVIREKGWQPQSLGGDGSVSDEILAARPDGLVIYSARCPGVEPDQVWSHFFQGPAGA